MTIMSSAKSTTSIDSESPASQYVCLYQSMRNLNDKLLALDYSKEFVTRFKCPPINRYYFCKQTNQSQQFFTFCCLTSYLLNKLIGTNDFNVDSFDDPNLTIDKILNVAQNYIDVSGFANVKQKLRLGHGPDLIDFLDKLVDRYWIQRVKQNEEEFRTAIKVKILSIDGTNLGDEDAGDEDANEIENDEDNEIELEEELDDYIIADDNFVEEDWDDEPLVDEPNRAMIVANTDITEWKLELERILPQLNAKFIGQSMYKSGAYDNEWRLHYQAAITHHSNIKLIFNQTDSMVSNLKNDLKLSLDKIQSKEKYLHQNLDTLLAEWTNVRERAVTLRQAFDQLNSETKAKTDRLQQLTEEDKSIKQSVEEYSLRMTDSSPLIEAKKARELLKQERIKINLQIGVAMQTLVRHVTLYTSKIY